MIFEMKWSICMYVCMYINSCVVMGVGGTRGEGGMHISQQTKQNDEIHV